MLLSAAAAGFIALAAQAATTERLVSDVAAALERDTVLPEIEVVFVPVFDHVATW